jgi:hypothetical protein
VQLHLIRVEERRLTAWRNLPHRITVTAPEWVAWLRLRRRGEGANLCTPRNTGSRKPSKSRSAPNAQKVCRRAEGRVGWREAKTSGVDDGQ